MQALLKLSLACPFSFSVLDSVPTSCSDKFEVEKIAYDENKNITGLSIMNTTNKKRVFLLKPPVEKK